LRQSHHKIHDSGESFRMSPDGLRRWAAQIRGEAETKAKSLEAMAAEIEAERGKVWPKSRGN
jgi:hypothetical protein